MNHKLPATILLFFIVTFLAFIGLIGCNEKPVEESLVVTRVSANKLNVAEAASNPHLPEAELILVHPENDKKPELLTPDFYSACSPHLSYDAKKILFLGQQKQDETWQVWEINLKNQDVRKLTDFETSCYTPFYLPGEQFVFSKEISDSLTGTSRMLFTMNLDGTNLHQITYHPHYDYVQTILRDGRILMNSRQVFPEKTRIKTLAMRPNGTKAEIFYQGNRTNNRALRFHETDSGVIYFTEQDTGDLKRNLVSIHQNRPLHSKVNYSENIAGNFYAAFPKSDDELFVSFRADENQNIGIYRFSVIKNSIQETLLSDSEYHYLDPVWVKPYQRPRNLPNELKYNFPTGLLMCQNVNLTEQADSKKQKLPKATKVEILGVKKSLGIVPVEDDGSFFLKLEADRPFRIQTLNENNEVVNEPSDWIWVRPFERRGCVGCHEDHEIAPENVVPMAVNNWPVLVPADSLNSELNQKTFELGEMH